MTHPSLRVPLAALVLAPLAACASGAADDRADADRLLAWSVDAEPQLHIGTDGSAETMFDRIRGAVRMPSGKIVVADGGSRELRVFAPNGTFVRTLSRRGSGPGEFESIGWIQRALDTIVAFDGTAGVLSYFTVDSGFVGRVARHESGALTAPRAVARLAGGALFMGPGFQALRSMPEGITRDSARLGIMDPALADTVVWLGYFPAMTGFGYRDPEFPGGVGFGRYVYGPQLVRGVSGNRIWIGDSGEPDIALYDASGARVGTATWPDSARPLDGDAIARVLQRELADSPSPRKRRAIEALHGAALRPPRAPLFASFVAGPDGAMWVERFREDRTAASEFVVFDSSGAARATITVPAKVRVQEIGADYLLGVLTDADGVQTVAQHGLRRSVTRH